MHTEVSSVKKTIIKQSINKTFVYIKIRIGTSIKTFPVCSHSCLCHSATNITFCIQNYLKIPNKWVSVINRKTFSFITSFLKMSSLS